MDNIKKNFLNFFLNKKVYCSVQPGRLLVVLLIFFGLFSLLCVGCLGASWWAAYDIQKNLDLARKEGYSYYISDDDIDKYSSQIESRIQKEFRDSFNKLVEKNKNNPKALDNFSLDVKASFSQDELLTMIFNMSSRYKDQDKNKEKLLKLIKDNNLMLKLVDNELHVVLPVTRSIYSELNVSTNVELNSLINSTSSLLDQNNSNKYLVNGKDLFIRFVFRPDGVKFKLDRFDFNDSWIVAAILESSVNNLIMQKDKNYIYQTFFDFSNLNYSEGPLTIKLSEIRINQDKLELNFNVSSVKR